MPGLKERAKTLIELADGADSSSPQRPLALDAKAAELAGAGGRARICRAAAAARGAADWTAAATEAAVRDMAEASGAKLGDVAQPLRAALTGRATSPGIFDVLEVLGPRGEPRPHRAIRRRA